MTSLYHTVVRRALRQATRQTTDTVVLTGKKEIRVQFTVSKAEYAGTWMSDTSSGTFETTREMNACIEALQREYKLVGAWSEANV